MTTRRLVQSWPRGENTAADLIAFRITGYEANQPTGMQNTAPVHDALCIAALVDPSLIATRFVNTIGRTVVDHEKRTKRAPNCHVAFAAERDKFFALLKDTFVASR